MNRSPYDAWYVIKKDLSFVRSSEHRAKTSSARKGSKFGARFDHVGTDVTHDVSVYDVEP